MTSFESPQALLLQIEVTYGFFFALLRLVDISLVPNVFGFTLVDSSPSLVFPHSRSVPLATWHDWCSLCWFHLHFPHHLTALAYSCIRSSFVCACILATVHCLSVVCPPRHSAILCLIVSGSTLAGLVTPRHRPRSLSYVVCLRMHSNYSLDCFVLACHLACCRLLVLVRLHGLLPHFVVVPSISAPYTGAGSYCSFLTIVGVSRWLPTAHSSQLVAICLVCTSSC